MATTIVSTPTIIKDGQNVVGMITQIPCEGMSKVGIRLAGTFVGTEQFEGSFDGATWSAISVTPYASGTTVQSSTATGTWLFTVGNYKFIRVRNSAYTSGTVLITLSASVDNSYIDALLAANVTFQTQTSAAATIQTLIVAAANSNHAWKITDLIFTVSGTNATGTISIKDGTTIIWQADMPVITGGGALNLTPFLPVGGVVGTVGNSMTVTVASAGGAITTTISATTRAA